MKPRKGSIWPPVCLLCGKLMAYRDSWMRFVNHGSIMDTDPPDDDFIHTKCWDALDEEKRKFWNGLARLPIGPAHSADAQ